MPPWYWRSAGQRLGSGTGQRLQRQGGKGKPGFVVGRFDDASCSEVYDVGFREVRFLEATQQEKSRS